MKKHDIVLPVEICKNISQEQLDEMIDISFKLDPLWENAIGDNWRNLITRDYVKSLFKKM